MVEFENVVVHSEEAQVEGKSAPEATPETLQNDTTPAEEAQKGTPAPAGEAQEGTPTPAGEAQEGTPTPAGEAQESTATPAEEAQEATPAPAGEEAQESTATPAEEAQEATPAPAGEEAQEATPAPAGEAQESTATPTGEAQDEGTSAPAGEAQEKDESSEDGPKIKPINDRRSRNSKKGKKKETFVRPIDLKKNRFYKRLYTKAGQEMDFSRQEQVAMLMMYRVYPVDDIVKKFGISRAQVYRLAQALSEFSELDEAGTGEIFMRHPEKLLEILKTHPEAFAYIISYCEKLQENCKKFGGLLTNVEIDEDTIHRFILALSLQCQASPESIHVCLRDVLGIELSHTAIEEIIKKYEAIGLEKAKELDIIVFPHIAAIALDEIFNSGGKPVFTVVDLDSTYSLLISLKEDRKAETWEEALRVLQALGLHPESAVSDACGSILVAVPRSFEDIFSMIDVFHVLKDLGDVTAKVIRHLEIPLTEAEDIKKRINEGVKVQARTLEKLYQIEDIQKPIILGHVATVRTLKSWIVELVGFNGYTPEESQNLLDWCLDELKSYAEGLAIYFGSPKESGCCKALIKAIEKFREHLPRTLLYMQLFFAHLQKKSEDENVDYELLLGAYRLMRYADNSAPLLEAMRITCLQCRCNWEELHHAQELVSEVIKYTPRASSLVENLNSRIRPTLSSKKRVENGYLNLLRLYLNTKEYSRSRRSERVDKSPFEIITGNKVNFYALLGLNLPTPKKIAA